MPSRKVLISKENNLEDQNLDQVIGGANLEEHIREILMKKEVFLEILQVEKEVHQETQTDPIQEEITAKSQS